MNVFIGITALLTLLVVAWLIVPLLRSSKTNGVSSEQLNAAIHRDQLTTLNADLARGAISQQDFEATSDELQLRLLDDTQSFDAAPRPGKSSFWSARRTASIIGLSLPVIAVGIYMQLGTPSAIDPVATAKVSDQQVRQMVDTLAARLKADPNNPTGWAMLARSYKIMGRLEEAKQAFENAGTLVNTEPELLLDYADLLGVLAGNRLEGKPAEMIEKALQLNPQSPMGLEMAGALAYQRSDFSGAVKRWEQLLATLDPNSPDAQQVMTDIADARGRGGMPQTDSNKLPPIPASAAAGMTPEKINEMVDRLAARLKNNPDDLAGWAKLARAYKVQGRLPEAAQAYAKTGKLMDSDANLLTQYADLLATQANNDFKGQPLVLINKALALDPKHPTGLMMAGQAAYRAANYPKAIAYWETVLTVLPPGSPDIDPIKSEIADAKAKAGNAVKP